MSKEGECLTSFVFIINVGKTIINVGKLMGISCHFAFDCSVLSIINFNLLVISLVYLLVIMPQLTVFLKAEIIVLHEQNKTISEIARQLHLTRKTVRLWVKRHGETGDIQRNRPGPAPVMFTDQSSRHRDIIARHTADPFVSTAITAAAHGIAVKTVRKHLHAAGFKTYKPARKIALSSRHRLERLRFAEEYINFDWSNNIVIFTDEKSFKSDKDGRKILWRRHGERYNELCVLPTRTSGRITLAYWGWMSSMGPGEIVEVGGRFNSEKYLEILRDIMLPTVRVAYPEGRIYFIQDNCSVHRAAVVQEWFATQNDITVINWPSKSPDLNVIENLWGQMVLNWDPSNIRTSQQLKELVHFTWESLRGGDLCSTMVSGMSNRLQQIIECEGRPLRY